MANWFSNLFRSRQQPSLPTMPDIEGPGHIGRLAEKSDFEWTREDVAAFVRGEMVLFVESSNVEYAKFYPKQDMMEVGFLAKDGNPPSAYLYYNVSPELAIAFANAQSKGKFIWDQFRIRGTVDGHKKRYDRIR